MTVTRRFLFLSVFFTFLTIPVLAQNSTAPTQTREGGLVNTTFTIPSAKITVTLPNDIAAGDTISGTVVTEPAGKNDAEKQRNSDTLSGYVIEVGNQKAQLAECSIIRIKIQTKDVIKLALADKTVASAPVPLQPANTSWTGTPRAFTLPSLGQEGRPIQIQGPFDGDSSNTKVSIGGSAAQVLAESPRAVVVANPSTIAGPTTIEVKENNTTTQGTFRNLKIDMSAPKTSLKKGESTELHVQVSGLEGITQPVPLRLTNQSPSTVNLGGGNQQIIFIQPKQVSSDGIFVWTGPVTGIQKGGFNITSDLSTELVIGPPSPTATTKPPK